MKAEECLKKYGDVARRDSDGAIATYANCQLADCGHIMHMGSNRTSMQGTDIIDGDDWIPLGPITNLDDLQRYEIVDSRFIYPLHVGRYVLFDDLAGRCLTRSEGEDCSVCKTADSIRIVAERRLVEKQEEIDNLKADIETACEEINRKGELCTQFRAERDSLTARVAELEEENGYLAVSNNSISENLTAAMKELATLREQCVLGEPLQRHDVIAAGEWYVRVPVVGPMEPELNRHELVVNDSHLRQGEFYRWPYPSTPVLPEPEPSVPEVPAWLGCVRNTYPRQYEENTPGKIGFVLGINEDELYVMDEGGWCGKCWSALHCELYNHPEVENTPALIAALSGEGANE